jgi:septal ring factor EnvC (AmiA/AmiB activator)
MIQTCLHKLHRCASVFVAILVFASFTLCVVDSASAQGSLESRIDGKQKELDKIKRDIEARRQKTQKLKKQESDVLSTLSALDRELDLSRSFLKNLDQQETLFTQQIDSLKAEILYESDSLDSRKKALAGRLRQMYKRDPRYSWDIVLGSRNVQDAMRRYKFMRIVADRDAGLVSEFRLHKVSLETQSAAMTESLSEMAMVRKVREDEASKLVSSKQKREIILSDIRGQKSKHNKAIERLKKAQGEVTDLIGQLETRRLETQADQLPGSGEFAGLKGQLPWPVKGKVRRGFGQSKHPKYGTVTFNNGIDIESSSGSPIQAVASGVVEFVDWIDAYGKCVIVNHGGGYYTLYAHVAQTFVAQGQKVVIGDVIAEVGDTGSLDGFECHFEIRQSKKALNPVQWLRRR